MTVVGLHPEELFDKLLEGELDGAERERLSLHLAGCEVCRFEYAARLDFQAEALTLGSAAPPLLLRTPQPAPAPAPEPASAVAPVRRRRSRGLVWGLAAAALIVASGAVAAIAAGKQIFGAESRVFSRAASAPAALRLAAPVNAIETAPALAPAPSPASLPPEPAPHALSPRRAHHARTEAANVNPAAPRAASTPVASPAKDAAAAEEPTAAKLFTEANQARRSGDVGRASGLYHLLQEQFPGSSEAELSRVTLSLLLLDGGDAQGALSGFERYLAGASRGLEAEALVGRARALGRLGRRDLEATAWQEVQRKYPRSIYGRQAGERLSALGVP